MRQLWIATFEVSVVVVADNEAEAERLASSHASDEIENQDVAAMIGNVTCAAHLPTGWADSLPYGGDGTMTCAEYLAEGEGDDRG